MTRGNQREKAREKTQKLKAKKSKESGKDIAKRREADTKNLQEKQQKKAAEIQSASNTDGGTSRTQRT